MQRAFPLNVKRHFRFTLVLTFCMAPLQCATLERLSLDDLIVKSTSIIRAKVAGSYTGFTGPVIYTHYKLQILEQLKGQASSELVIPGGIAGGQRQFFAGMPSFQNGDEYVFFLWTGSDGLTQVTGLTQGLFRVTAASSDPPLTREATHELMLDRQTARPVRDQTITMRLSDLRSHVKTTLAAQRPAQ